VLIESDDGTGHTWSTVGVDENIIAASWHALEEAVTYWLLRSGRRPVLVRENPAHDRL
jgi:2-isopropylmalate synthase